jgi:hypothetical protein
MIFTVKCWLLFTYNEKFIQYYYITLLQPLRLPTARMFGAISFPSLPISLYSSPPTLVFLSLCNALGRFCVRSINFGCDLFSNPGSHSCTLPDSRLHLDVILLSTRYGGWLFMILASHRSKLSGYISQPVCNGHPICPSSGFHGCALSNLARFKHFLIIYLCSGVWYARLDLDSL